MLACAQACRRPRPVADAPPLDGREIAQAWLVELVASAPLDRAAALPGEGFADEAPRLCAALAAALSNDAALADLQEGGVLAGLSARVGSLAGAGDGAEVVAAVEALRAVTWAAIATRLVRPQPAQVADLADRLALILSTLTVAAIEHHCRPAGDTRGGPLAAVLAGADRARTAANGDEAPPPAEGPDPTLVGPAAPGPPPGGPVEVDFADPAAAVARLAGLADPARVEAPSFGSVEEFPIRAHATTPRPGAPVVEDASAFHARVAPWTAAIDRRLARRAEDGLPFAVVCVEVADLDRLVSADHDRDVAAALEAAEGAALTQLRPADALVRERPGRLWLIAPDTDDRTARDVADRIGAAVAGVSTHRGAPLDAAAGVAVCPQDGDDAAALEGRAEEALFAARAAGLRVAARPD